MHTYLWGPPLWQLLFSVAWNAPRCAFERLCELVFELVPPLLPCQHCRESYPSKQRAATRRCATLSAPRDVFAWLWFLKDEVNKSLLRHDGREKRATLLMRPFFVCNPYFL